MTIAAGGEDYVELRKELSLDLGDTQKCVAVIIREDELPERDETFMVQVEGLQRVINTEVVLSDDDGNLLHSVLNPIGLAITIMLHCSIDISFNYTGNSPVVRNNHVTFHLSFGGGVLAARCAVLKGNQVLEETDCKYQS